MMALYKLKQLESDFKNDGDVAKFITEMQKKKHISDDSKNTQNHIDEPNNMSTLKIKPTTRDDVDSPLTLPPTEHAMGDKKHSTDAFRRVKSTTTPPPIPTTTTTKEKSID